MSTENDYQYLERRFGSLYRQPFIKGTRIRVEIPYGRSLAHEDEAGLEVGEPLEQIAQDFQIPVEAVKEAIEYCNAHWDVVMADHAREERLLEATGMNHPQYKYNPSKYYKMITPEERHRIINDDALPG